MASLLVNLVQGIITHDPSHALAAELDEVPVCRVIVGRTDDLNEGGLKSPLAVDDLLRPLHVDCLTTVVDHPAIPSDFTGDDRLRVAETPFEARILIEVTRFQSALLHQAAKPVIELLVQIGRIPGFQLHLFAGLLYLLRL